MRKNAHCTATHRHKHMETPADILARIGADKLPNQFLSLLGSHQLLKETPECVNSFSKH
jgi:hypothetical protein